MPEIGDQLRETRMRNRIDITDVEAATKIRAKYLRALENEEWDLLPGPTFVKTFLRTYADYLGLDARNLVEEYREGDEQAAGPTATPAATAGAGDDGARKKKRKAAPQVVRLQIQPTGPVSVCLENIAGEPLIQNLTLDAGQDTETFRSRRFRVSFGTGAAVMRVGRKSYDVSDDAPIGYELKPGRKPRTLPESERPTCGA
jgi:hypothetical protein